MPTLATGQSLGKDADDDHQQQDELPKQGRVDRHEISFFMAKAMSSGVTALGKASSWWQIHPP